jgi:hypothetical protein
VRILLYLLLLLLAARPAYAQDKPARVRIENRNGNFRLLRNGEPYFIKGAVGSDYLDKLKAYGGNSIRTTANPRTLPKPTPSGSRPW